MLFLTACNGITIELPGEPPVAAPEVVIPGPESNPAREVLFFTQKGCPPCERARPRLEEMRKQGLKVTEIDIREQPDLARQYQIRQTPTFIVLQDGVEIERTSDIVLLITILVKLLAWILPLLLG
jgi:thiol-disulfide isomerase/thioredoxin